MADPSEISPSETPQIVLRDTPATNQLSITTKHHRLGAKAAHDVPNPHSARRNQNAPVCRRRKALLEQQLTIFSVLSLRVTEA